LDAALESPNGVAIETPTQGQATYLRHRLYAFRVLDRKASMELYEVGDPRRGRSVYDTLNFSCEGARVEIRHSAPLKVYNL